MSFAPHRRGAASEGSQGGSEATTPGFLRFPDLCRVSGTGVIAILPVPLKRHKFPGVRAKGARTPGYPLKPLRGCASEPNLDKCGLFHIEASLWHRDKVAASSSPQPVFDMGNGGRADDADAFVSTLPAVHVLEESCA